MIVLAALLIAGAPAQHEQLLVLDLEAIEVDPPKVSILNGRIASTLSERTDVETITAGDIKAMASVQASKATLGCEESSCLAEIANALGTRYVLYGRVGKLDDVILLQLNLFDATVGKAVARQEAQGKKLQELSEKIPGVLSALLRPLGGTAPVSQAAVVESGGPSTLFLAGAGALGAGALIGLGCGAWALALNGDLESTTATLDQKKFAYDNGILVASTAIAGGVLAAAGGVALGVGLAE